MEDLSAIFGMLGLFGLIFFTIVTIINKIKRNGKSTKKYMLISLALFIVGLLIPSESSTPKQPEEQKQEATEIKDKPEKEVKKEANKKEKEEPKQKKESKEVTNKDTQKESEEIESEEEISEKETITKNKSEKKVDSSNQTKKIYDAARAIPVMNGFNTEKIGEMSLIKTDSALVDKDVILDWYLNYVEKTDYLYYIISYVDKEEQLGVYANSSGLIEVNTQIEKDENNVFMLGDDSKAIYYTVGEDNKLKKIEF